MPFGVLVHALVRRFRRPPGLSASYASYADASAACGTQGYEEPALVAATVASTRDYRERLSAGGAATTDTTGLYAILGTSLGWVERAAELHVLDFGGALGAHYFTAKAVWGEALRVRWHVVETPAMVRAGREFESDELRFFDRVSDAAAALGRVDLVYSSGALQYLPDPYRSLEELVACGARTLVLTRLGLAEANGGRIWVQETQFRENGPAALPEGVADGRARYVVTMADRARVEALLRADYEIRLVGHEPRGEYRFGAEEFASFAYYGVRR